MFLIAGISPKEKTLENTPRRCPVCGLSQAYMKRIDHYFSLFFVPLFPVKKGEPILVCNRCRAQGVDNAAYGPPRTADETIMCKQCGRTLEKNFSYCPYCGKLQ